MVFFQITQQFFEVKHRGKRWLFTPQINDKFNDVSSQLVLTTTTMQKMA